MMIWRNRRSWIVATISLMILTALVALIGYSADRVEVRGKLSTKDIAEIKRLHRFNCPIVRFGSHPEWFPYAIRRQVSVILNPIDVICAPEDGEVIVVYRG